MKDETALRPTVLVVEPDATARSRLQGVCAGKFECLDAASGAEALKSLQDNFVEVVLCSTGPRAPEGAALLQEIGDHWPETVRIALCPPDENRDLPDGLYQIIPPDMEDDGIVRMLRNAAQLFRVRRENDRMSFEIRFRSTAHPAPPPPPARVGEEGLSFEGLLRGQDSPLNAVIAEARHLASFDVPILITGATGTGKADLARAIHDGSLRGDRPFHAINLCGLTDEQMRLELAGLRNNGASRIGLMQKSERGTLFLNGIDRISCDMQLWLARILASGQMTIPGQSDPQRINFRLIAGSGCDLRQRVAEGSYLPELYHAAALGSLSLPGLAERRCDIPVIAHHLLFEAASQHGKSVRGFSAEAIEFLSTYDWPGNLPELQNEVTRMLIFAQERTLGADLISRHILQAQTGGASDPAEDAVIAADGPLKDRVEEVEKRILREVLTRLKWNKSRAAVELGLSRVGLRAKLERYGLTPGVVDAPDPVGGE